MFKNLISCIFLMLLIVSLNANATPSAGLHKVTDDHHREIASYLFDKDKAALRSTSKEMHENVEQGKMYRCPTPAEMNGIHGREHFAELSTPDGLKWIGLFHGSYDRSLKLVDISINNRIHHNQIVCNYRSSTGPAATAVSKNLNHIEHCSVKGGELHGEVYRCSNPVECPIECKNN
jgi:hypothetical protein